MLRPEHMPKHRPKPALNTDQREYRWALLFVKAKDITCWQTYPESQRDDAARRSPDDKVEVVNNTFPGDFLDPGKNRRSVRALISATIETEDAKRD